MKHWKYLKYLVRHKWFVFLAGLKTGAPIWRLIIHDWSKCLPCEWFPYVEYFYGATLTDDELMELWRKEQAILGYRATPTNEYHKGLFNRAWLHHQHANPHHWQHWVLREDSGNEFALPMPEKFIREMVADWAGAGRAITGRWEVWSWFEKNREKMTLHDVTQIRVAQLLEKLKDGEGGG
jgi:hypothetical protein